jgi:D-glycero-D-manno-heptose 1,7-bisphosphate phosphatase
MKAAVFLDRDGVLIEDVPLMTRWDQISLIAGAAQALRYLGEVGFKLIVVSNQAIVARGLLRESDICAMNRRIAELLVRDGAPPIHGFYFCPHHPNATLLAYRQTCNCRKPEPGLLLTAAREHDVDLKASFVVGDRLTDILAGARAGCRTVLVQTGAHDAPLIETGSPIHDVITPDHVCRNLGEAAKWILEKM